MSADRHAIEAILEEHQRRTLKEYAACKGLEENAAWSDPSYRTVAIALAVDKTVKALVMHEQISERQALARAAVEFNLDIETLLRRRRRFRRRG